MQPTTRHDAVGSSSIRRLVSGEPVRSVSSAAVIGYRDLSDFERSFIVGARGMRQDLRCNDKIWIFAHKHFTSVP